MCVKIAPQWREFSVKWLGLVFQIESLRVLWSRLWCPWFMLYALWLMVYGLWSLVYGLCLMVYGLWYMVYDWWFVVYGLGWLCGLYWGWSRPYQTCSAGKGPPPLKVRRSSSHLGRLFCIHLYTLLHRLWAKRKHLATCWWLLPESQGQNVALTLPYTPYSLDSGTEMVSLPAAPSASPPVCFRCRRCSYPVWFRIRSFAWTSSLDLVLVLQPFRAFLDLNSRFMTGFPVDGFAKYNLL